MWIAAAADKSILRTFCVSFCAATIAGAAGKRQQQKRSQEAIDTFNRQMGPSSMEMPPAHWGEPAE